jgi:N-acetylglutamate synthase-like GNAT family acetyltransferase
MQSSQYHIITDKSKMNITRIHQYLSEESYWAKGIPLETVQRSMEHSICFAVMLGEEQVGFARIISDEAVFAYLADVFILEAHRGKGLSKMLMEYISNYPSLQGLRRWMLATLDAQGLYAQYGFTALEKPECIMQKHFPDVYATNSPTKK